MTKSDALRKLVEHARENSEVAERLASPRSNSPRGIELLKLALVWEEAAQWIERKVEESE